MTATPATPATSVASSSRRLDRAASCRTLRRRGHGREAGLATVELVLITPLVFALLAFIVGLGRSADARGRLTGAARDAARAASLTATPDAAAAAARQVALIDLDGAGMECRAPQVETDTRQFRPGGVVGVSIRCTLDLSSLLVSGLPGHSTLTAHAAVPLDSYSPLIGTSS